MALNKKKVKTEFDAAFASASKSFNIPLPLLKAIAFVESGFNEKVISKLNGNGTRDYGLMQINESNFNYLGIDKDSALDAKVSIAAACQLLNSVRNELGDKFTVPFWIAAYNAGSPAVLRRGIFNVQYVDKVLAKMKEFS